MRHPRAVRYRLLSVLGGLLFGAGLCLSARAQTATPTPSRSDLTAWSLNGHATHVEPRSIRLTHGPGEVGSAWGPCSLDLDQDFTLDFLVDLGPDAAASDGMAFVLHRDAKGVTAIGANGGGLGYGDLTASLGYDPATGIHPSVAFELDTNYNDEMTALGEPSCDHLAVVVDGLLENPVAVGPVCAVPSPTPGYLSDGKEHRVHVHWDAAEHLLTLSLDTGSVLSYNRDLAGEVFGGNTLVRWGWTAGTGGGWADQTFSLIQGMGCPSPTPSPTASPTPTPLPGGHVFVYPNPARGDNASLAYPLDSSGTVRVRVYNSAYDLVMKREQQEGPGDHVMALELGGVAPGLYFLLLETETSNGRRDYSPIKFYVTGRP